MEYHNLIKGQVTQTLVASLMERAGYRVTRLGLEELLADVKHLSWSQYQSLQLPAHLRSLPDLLVAEPDLSEACMVEVKYCHHFDNQAAQSLHEELGKQRESWPDSFAVVMVGQPHEGGHYHQHFMRVVGPDDLDRLVEKGRSWQNRWKDLPQLQDVFRRIKGRFELQQEADSMTQVLHGLAGLNPRHSNHRSNDKESSFG